ncbi:class I SAM-dependent methyltransferase [Solidesulfovibrio sp.]|uniref:class I SAM-dependent methyltransferase n=1 Tax=Solidesulfovibrio sp. TaxID=2910990 RepID=UPI002B20EA54|nr:class I SAM-dependent methyltransferase [Solidesulfovibrio sp.]MEA5090929.1 class I SAM-dependent methyltransferase [Solidesulfovibrio sp.]
MTNPVACPLCDGRDAHLVTDTVRFGKTAEVRRCPGCGLTFLNQDSFEYPTGFYESVYHQTYLTHVEPDALDPAAYFEKMRKAVAPWADRFAAMLTGNETVLDLGCSTGHFLDLIRDKAKSVHGHDLNVAETRFCREKLGLDVSTDPLEKRFPEGSFDYITMIYVLEHIAKPKPFLEHVKKFLRPGGKIVILVPNIQDPLVQFYDIPEFRAFYYCIEHLFYYDQHTIRRLFDDAGLSGSVEVLQEYPITNHLNWAYRRKPSDTLAARRGVPDVALAEGAPQEAWQGFWEAVNAQYRTFLTENGYGDRLWCTVGNAR